MADESHNSIITKVIVSFFFSLSFFLRKLRQYEKKFIDIKKKIYLIRKDIKPNTSWYKNKELKIHEKGKEHKLYPFRNKNNKD